MPASLSEAKEYRIYGSRFVDYVKNEGTPDAYDKFRFIIQGFDDEQDLLTHAPTVMRASQRLFCACASEENRSLKQEELIVKNRDVNQTFSQAKSTLCRKVFVRPNHVLGCPRNFLFAIIYPTYGLLESPIHWFKTYRSHH